MKLGELRVPPGATHRKKRKGLGESSGHGKTSGRGHKGQRARSGPGLRPEFEGGQMPLIRRIPKRGFTHVKVIPIQIVNVSALNRFPSGSVVDPSVLTQERLIHSDRARRTMVKILGEGELAHPLRVKAHRFSKSALEKIAKAGGTVEHLSL